jgi:hypothetical protein
MRNISRRQAIMPGTPAMAVIGLTSFARATDAMNNIGRAIIPFTIMNNSGIDGAGGRECWRVARLSPRKVKYGGIATC